MGICTSRHDAPTVGKDRNNKSQRNGQYATSIADNDDPSTSIQEYSLLHSDIVFDLHPLVSTHTNSCQLLTASEDRSAALYDVSKHTVVKQWPATGSKGLTRVTAAAGSQHVYTAGRDKTIRQLSLLDDTTQTYNADHQHHALPITGLDVSPTGSHLLSGSRDYKLQYWQVERPATPLLSFTEIYQNSVTSVHSIDDNTYLQTSEDLQLRVWDVRRGGQHPVWAVADGPQFALNGAVLEPHTFATVHNGFESNGCEVKVWDQRKDCVVHVMTGHSQAVSAVSTVHSASSVGLQHLVVTGSKDSTIRVWNTQTGECLAVCSVPAHSISVQSICAFAADDGKTVIIVAGTVAGTLVGALYNVATQSLAITWQTRREDDG